MARQTLIQAFGHAGDGIRRAARERNFKIELGFGIAAIVLGIVLRIDLVEWAVVAVCIGCVLGGECLNTSLEALVDLASPDYNELAKVAKDCAAGAVFICSIASLFVAAFIFLPKILAFMFAIA